MTDQDRQKETVRRIYASCWNMGDMASIDDIFAVDVEHGHFLPGWPKGREGFKALVQFWRNAFPDIREDVVEILSEGDQVASRFRLQGTHQGDFYGIPGTGRTVDIYGAEIFRFRDGKVVEYVYHEDTLGLFFQLGVLPLGNSDIAGVLTKAA
ncbi:ester cyclase [Sphingosinicellaceae bacterium]|nr:ester cyclase [Sphingosinicellaceae bacterium]